MSGWGTTPTDFINTLLPLCSLGRKTEALEYLAKDRKMKRDFFEENHEQVKAADGIFAGFCDRDTFSGQRHQ